MDVQSLNGDWELRRADGDTWHPGTVPGGVYGDLLDAGVIEDPYVEDNELDVQWVGETDWTYRRRFAVDPAVAGHDRVLLRCAGVDTVAELFLNGERVGATENMFRAHEFPVGGALESGENELEVRFRSPAEYAAERMDAHPYEVPALGYPVDQPGRNFVRKAGCHFGWDWGPCLPEVGLWRDVELVGHSGPRITHVTTEQTHQDGAVELAVRVGVEAPAPGRCEVSASVAGADARGSVRLEGGQESAEGDDPPATATGPGGTTVPGTGGAGAATGETTLGLAVDDPDLWWPAGYGEQPLNDLEVRAGDGSTGDVDVRRIGFRELDLLRDDEGEAGERFYFRVNGTEVFAKGANWIPADALHGGVDRERHRELLESAADANMNVIRVWGGGYYEHDHFYELCDELGLLVWQDFTFACALYPADDAFLAEVAAEARYQTRRLSSHPSLALWCGNNENEVSIRSWFADADHHDRLVADYEALYGDLLAGVVAAEDPATDYWVGSPSSGPGYDDPELPERGDIHFWDVWHEGAPFERYEEVRPRFVSEFGYQSFPSVGQLADVVPDSHHNPTAPLMEHHQRHPRGNRLILSRMADHFRMPCAFGDFVSLSQVQQALAMKTAIEHWRRCKPYCMGSVYWQLNDLWPVASWSSIQYDGGWKALQHVARRFYAPVLPSTVLDVTAADEAVQETPTAGELQVWLTSDVDATLDGRVHLEVFDVAAGKVGEMLFDADLDPLASEQVGAVPLEAVDAPAERAMIRVSYDGDEGTSDARGENAYDNHEFLVPYKRLELPEVDLDVSVDGDAVTVAADGAALFVELSADLEGRFSDDYFHLAPGEARTVAFESDGDVADLADHLSVTHLAETY